MLPKTNPDRGWHPWMRGNLSLLVSGEYQWLWRGWDPAQRRQVLQAVIHAWFERSRSFTVAQYLAGKTAGQTVVDPNEIPVVNYNGRFGDKVRFMIPEFRKLGIDRVLLNQICDWAKTLWPRGDWDAIKG